MDLALWAAAMAALGGMLSGGAAWLVALRAGKLAREAEDRKATAHLKGLAGAILGELEAYVDLLNIPVTRQNYLEMANATDMRERLAIIPKLPETHPVFDRCADQIGVLPGDLPREVSKLYNYATGIRLLINGLSNPIVEKVPNHIVSERIERIVDGFDRGLALYKEVAPALRQISGSPKSVGGAETQKMEEATAAAPSKLWD